MDEDAWDLTEVLTELAQIDELTSLGPILKKKNDLSPKDRQDLLDILSDQLLDAKLTAFVAGTFAPLLPELFQRGVKGGQEQTSQKVQDKSFIAAGKCLLTEKCGIERSLVLSHLASSPAPFQRQGTILADPPRKKKKSSKKPKTDEEIVRATLKLVEFDRDKMASMWDWDNFGNYLCHKDKQVVWYACQTLARLNRLCESEKEALLAKHLSIDEIEQFSIRALSELTNRGSAVTAKAVYCSTRPDCGGGPERVIYSQDLSPGVVSVCGILLSKTNKDPEKELQNATHQIVHVQSTRTSLQNLALAIISGSPVLLEGPVGSGKTSYVEHIAHLTGRQNPSGLIKVQLGDQTDSKALVGTYRCTEIPGEFVWQPGPLTQAVLEGTWILLEDLDYAPMDVISVLLPLLESGSLTIPGHGDMVRAAPGFQIFATQRLYSHQGGLYRQQSTHSAVLDHCWTKVRVNSLSRNELLQVITKLYPVLETVADKLLEIFLLLCASDHEEDEALQDTVAMETEDKPPTEQHLWKQRGDRLVSTRDLLKWCSRISGDHDLATSQTGNLIFQEALDCFSSCLPKPEIRLAAAQAIGALINIPREQARFFCQSYKPVIEAQSTTVKVGRVLIPKKKQDLAAVKREDGSTFSFTRHSLVLLERIASCILRTEPVLLVGETGTGKTSTVQYLAELLGQRLKVINMNQQSDSTDLLGGYKPVDIRRQVGPLRESFEELFMRTFSRRQNIKFLSHIQNTFHKGKWQDLLKLMDHTISSALTKTKSDNSKSLTGQWEELAEQVTKLKLQVKHAEGALAFTFVEGTLVRALHDGDWILLDEINLASAETLECLSSLLEGPCSSLMLMEKGDLQPVVRHPDFRLFACMNPATDIGKKDLPMGIRNRFTEFFVDELVEYQDLKILICDYLKGFNLTTTQVQNIVTFYTSVRGLAQTKLMDGTGHHPHFSLRTLCRALGYAAANPCGSVPRSLYESFCLSFLTQLDKASCPMVRSLILKHIVGKSTAKGILQQPIPPPAKGDFVKVEGYWVASGSKECTRPSNYIITPSVRTNLKMLARIVSARRFPVLLQGETSVGKTSLIQYLAHLSGNTCVRVNNHEHTDLQEYVGFYAADESGKLVFKEGVLVDAMRKGFWIILDELNLAPSDVLEALNRLLDDNRELFIPETQETVKAHPGFMLFATQNPPGQYGGRKILSRAFRNRFVELHFDEIPSHELETILHGRCSIPLSYSQKMVAVMLELQLRRKGSGVFAGKSGFMTLRDLFRWAERYRQSSLGQYSFHDWDQHIADEGYLLLAGKVRHSDEREVVREVLQQKLKRTVNADQLFTLDKNTSLATKPVLEKIMDSQTPEDFKHLVWTSSLRRLAVLVGQAIRFEEPVLLVGETGCGKTTICQLFSELANKQLFTVNCHLHTETSDFLGGLRPVRSHTEEETKKLFEWCDGPLVLSMKQGNPFLIDEISLADDSVLERLNSVLEPEQKLLLAERGSGEDQGDVEEVQAKKGFHITATMNPGGDFGKKELSPALRNRFTEIWCEQSTVRKDLVAIIEHNIKDGIQLYNSEDNTSGIGTAMMEFIEWFKNSEVGQRCVVSIRDLLSWVNFVNTCCDSKDSMTGRLEPAEAFVHGACLVFLDRLGSGPHSYVSGHTTRQIGFEFLQEQVMALTGQKIDFSALTQSTNMVSQPVDWVKITQDSFGIPPFYIPRGPLMDSSLYQYTLSAPTTALNALRLLRALQLPKAVLLEGSPGVGKTSLVTALARSSGNNIIRINLSEQTDVTDLFGADLPVEGGEGGQFAWRDGPLLQALKAGHWVVLDELNLASQSVLEGLNACLDHRGEIFVPELGKYFQIQHEKTRIFACQNPLKQGGGRKGLPKSFLNRFTQVYMAPLGPEDLLFIASTMYPDIPRPTIQKMVEFSQRLCEEVSEKRLFGQRGGPWEFNLRDLFRWCDLMVHDQGWSKAQWDPGQHVGLIYAERLRLPGDKEQVLSLYTEVFGEVTQPYRFSGGFLITPSVVQVGYASLPRNTNDCQSWGKGKLHLLHHDLQPLESLMKCLQMNWMAILVGPSGGGKSTIAQLTAALTGHSLKVLAMNSAMDTTELLGGFEQTDLYRHYERLKAGAEKATILLQRVCLKNSPDGLAVLQTVQSSWSLVCSQKTGNQNQDAFKEKLKRLDDHLVTLKESTHIQPQIQQDVDNLLLRLQHLSERVTVGDKHVLGGGGQFEWVDGLLVQALQEGDWLLIDNVNFCSPSVLDRLNGLLEPNGVLTINERGIIDGEIPTIKPHPNFRLILAMDPKYGEISRAMRNRGVEICVAPETSDYSYKDMMTLLKGMGLSTEGSKQLIRVHMAVKDATHNVGSISSLLLAASLTQEYLQTGRSWVSSLRDSCTRVYVTSQLLKINQGNASAILETALINEERTPSDEDAAPSEKTVKGWDETVIPTLGDGTIQQDTRHIQLPSVGFLRTDSALAMARRDTAIVKFLCQNLVSCLETDEDLPLALSHSILDALSRASHKDRNLRCQLLVELLPRLPLTNITPDTLKAVLDAVFQNPLFSELKAMQESDSEVWRHVQCLPIDLHTVPQMMDYLMHSTSSPLLASAGSQSHMCSILKQSMDAALRFHLMMWRSFKDLDNLASLAANKSPMEYSQALASGQLTLDDLPHPAFAHLSHFFKAMARLMDTLLNREKPTLTETSMLQVKVCYQWVSWFQEVCRQCFQGRASISLLALHWGWVQRKALSVLVTTLGGLERFPLEFEALVNGLDNSLGLPAAALERILKSASAHLGLPPPNRDERHAQWLDRVNRITRKLEISERPKKKHVWRLLMFLKDKADVGHQVLRLLWRCKMSEDIEGIDEDIDKLEKVVKEHLGRAHNEGRKDEPVSRELEMKAMILPVQELLVLRQLHRKTSDLGISLLDESGQPVCEDEISALQELTTFTVQCPSVNSRLILPVWSVSQDQSYDRCLWTEVWSSILASFRQSIAVVSPGRWRYLLLSDLQETMVPQTDLTRNPALLLTPLQTLQAFNLLHSKIPEASSPPDKNDAVSLCDPIMSKGVPLGCWKERLFQLQEFSRLLWSNSGWVNSASCCHSKVMTRSLFTTVCWLLSSLKALVTAESEASWDHCMVQIRTLLLQTLDPASAPSPLLQDTVSLILSLLTAGSESTLSDGRGRLSAKMEQGLREFHSEILKWAKNLLEGIVALTSLVSDEAGVVDSANGKAVIRRFEWLLCLGRCWMCHGHLQTILLAPRGPVDPAQRTSVKLRCVKGEIQNIEAELHVKTKRQQILTGQMPEATDPGRLPERLRLLHGRLQRLRKKEEKLTTRVAYRPHPPQYDQLREDITHYLESIGSSVTIEGTLVDGASAFSALTSLRRKRHQKESATFLREVEGWRRSQSQFLANLEATYPMYRDLWAGMAAGAYGVAVGSQLVQHGIEAAMHRSKLDWKSPEGVTLEGHLSLMGRFPFTSSMLQADSIISETSEQVFCYSGEENSGQWDKFQVRLMKLALLFVTNHVDLSAMVDAESYCRLQGILERFVEWWHQSEEDRKRREEEEASLFKYKKQSHGSDEMPEETEEREIRAAFPSYDKDFADIDVDPTKDPPTHNPEEESGEIEDDSIVRLDEDTQRLVQTAHQQIYCCPRASEVPDQMRDLAYVVDESYKCTAEMYTDYLPWMAPNLDAKLIGAHLTQCKLQQDTISGVNTSHCVMVAGKPFDIYHDPRPSEVVKCLPLLRELTERVDKLMEEWPDHPALKHLKLVVARIESFPVNSPLMKFLLGLEMVLAKAQDWQEVAAKHVSLQTQLSKITELVIEWRKMELSFWSSSLDSVSYHHRQGVVKWWFHIYRVIQNMTSDPADVDAQQEGEEEAEDWLTTLQKFMEGSTLGDFQTRLDMVLAFHYQLDQDPSCNGWATSASSVLWNLHRYYRQFVPGVEDELSKQRKPLEKELKEFVKICRWNDINFWAMKAAVDKSHKTVHKICRKYQATLEGLAKVVFTDMNISSKGGLDQQNCESDITHDLWVQVFNGRGLKGTIPSRDNSAVIDTHIERTFDSESLMSRLPSLSAKVEIFCKRLVKNSLYEEATSNLDDFGGEIVVGSKELQSLDVTKDADKEKQKSEAKHINLRKRKALSELFKALLSLGLSYRKGLVMRNENLMTESFSLPKIDAKATTTSVGEVIDSKTILEILETKLEKSENYYFLNHARKAKLLTALENPSKELGLPNLERCKGFSEHLSRVTLEQRKKIGCMSDQIKVISDITSQLVSIGHLSCDSERSPLPPQRETERWLERYKELLDQTLLVISQYQLLLDSCPASQSGEERLPSPVSSGDLSAFEKMSKEDEAFHRVVGKLKTIQNDLQTLKPALDKRLVVIRRGTQNGRTQLLFWSDIDLLDGSLKAFSQSTQTMSEVLGSFWMKKDEEYASTAHTLLELKDNITEMVRAYQTWRAKSITDTTAHDVSGSQCSLDERMERLLSGLLLSIQTVTQQNGEEHREDDKEESKNDLTELLGTKLDSDVSALDLPKIMRLASSLISDLQISTNVCQVTPASVGLLLRVLPIMHQYLRLAWYYFTQMVVAHKSSTKLLYILLGIFNELAEKGFCIPEEFSDELSGEGATEFADIEGGGIDDGEGVKDVSDQIEDEEQVQDVKREGEEEKEDQNQDDLKDEKEGIEMSEDFEGKMQDMEPEEAASDDEDGMDQDELDKQMGDVDKDDMEKLDEKMWGDEEDPEQEEEGEKDQKEEHGDGDEEEEDTQLVAKDDNRGDAPDDEDKDKKRKEGKDEGEDGPEAPEPKTLEQPFDENEINDDEIDPSKANDPPPEPVAEDLELPDDLDLENDGEGDDDELGEDGEMEENPLDIERPPTPIKEMDTDERDAGDGKDEEEDAANSDEQQGDEPSEMEEGVKEEAAKDVEEDKTEKSDKPEEEEGNDDDADMANEDHLPDKPHDTEHIPEDAENAGKSADKTDSIKKSEPLGTEEAGKTDEKKEESEEKATGLSETQQESGHEGAVNSKTALATNTQQDPTTSKRKPGHSDTDRSLGQEEKGAKRLKTIDNTKDVEGEQPKEDENKEAQESELYEHLKDAQSYFDAQTVDTATEEQVEETGITMETEDEDGVGTGDQEEMPALEEMETVEEKTADRELEGHKYPSGKVEENDTADGQEPSPDLDNQDAIRQDTPFKKTQEAHVSSSIHTNFTEGGEVEELVISDPAELESVRKEIEEQLSSLHESGGREEDMKAQKVWHECEAVTSGLARELCEQLRLVLEPTQASKLRGDYRTGKRINMRKVIPYIASGFRKDKIWLRRTKPSKREYQILLAVDDSSSMADNRSRQMAFESMALVSNALTWLEAGQLAVCSFGESVQLLHPFHEQFSDQSGARILQEFTFSQKKTKIAQLLKYATSMMSVAKCQRAPGAGSNVQTSQLLLVMSDGRGLYLEGLEKVKSAVRAARDANIFLVFLILDNPENKDSILDIKVPVFKPDGLPDIHSYMEHFPFPFYIMLRDINALPTTLSDALRQWFELVTAGDNH